MKPWEPNVEDATKVAQQTTQLAQRLTIMLKEKGVLTDAEEAELLGIYDPHE